MLNDKLQSCIPFSCQSAGGAASGSPSAALAGRRKKGGHNEDRLLPLSWVHNACQVMTDYKQRVFTTACQPILE